MIVRNEEATLAACLGSVRDLVNDMVVVDSGSTDRTKEIAAEFGAKVVDFVWCDDFAAARNESLRHATGDWIFWLDGDEHLNAENQARLRALIAKLPAEDNVAFTMRQSSVLEAGPHAAAHVDQVRLFRNHPAIRWEHRIHEQILPTIRRQGGSVARTAIVITHTGYEDPALQGAKVQRNQRLLELELQEHPDDPFVLFNLGNIAMTQGRLGEALAHYRRSLDLSQPGDNLVPKLHALVTRCHQQAGQAAQALAACRAGRALFPRNLELAFWEGILLREAKDFGRAEACFLQVLQSPEENHFTSIDAGLRGYRTRHYLAEMYRDQGRVAAAEAQWRAAVAECPAFTPGWLALGDLLLSQQRWLELDQALQRLQGDAAAVVEGKVLRARAHLARHEFGPARELLEEASNAAPQALAPRVFLSHVLLQEGKHWQAAEQVLRSILALAPDHPQARHNLQILLRQQAKEALSQPRDGPAPIAASSSDGKHPRTSLCMIVKNEERNLAACLDSVADLVDEMVVVDTGSTDATREIASRFGARVFEFPWVDSFAAARNESLRHARGDWILWLDADDRLDEVNRGRLRALLTSLPDTSAAYVFKCLCLPDSTGTSTLVDHIRLFRSLPTLRWRYRIHEQILPALKEARVPVQWSEVIVHHTGYLDGTLRASKLERDLRLLRLEQEDDPNNPFTLFNLGSVILEQGKPGEALPLLERSLGGCRPQDSIVRKLFVLLTQTLRRLDRREDALRACLKGLRVCPGDAELLFQAGICRRDLGDLVAAEAAWKRVLHSPPGKHFASVHAGLRGYLTAHSLAMLYREQNRLEEAEQQWRHALAAQPDYAPAWEGLAELRLARQDWANLEALAKELMAMGKSALAALLRARAYFARGEFEESRRQLQPAIEQDPKAMPPRLLYAYTLLKENKDPLAAERALRDILRLDPAHRETRQNLVRLLRLQGKPVDEELLPPS